MTRAASPSQTVTLNVPFHLVKRGGRKEMVLPSGTYEQRSRIDNTLVKALARAHRWSTMLESGGFLTVAELARAENISKSYLSCVLSLNLLAPDIVEAILEGRQPEEVTFDVMRKPFPVGWDEQRERFMPER